MHSKCCFTTFSRIDVPAKQKRKKLNWVWSHFSFCKFAPAAQLGQMCSSPNSMDQYLSTCCTSICRSLRELEVTLTIHPLGSVCRNFVLTSSLDRLGNWQMLDSDKIGFSAVLLYFERRAYHSATRPISLWPQRLASQKADKVQPPSGYGVLQPQSHSHSNRVRNFK